MSKPSKTVFDLPESVPEEAISQNPTPDSVGTPMSSKNANANSNGMGMIGIVVVVITLIVIVVGGILLYKQCSAEEPMGSQHNQIPNDKQGPVQSPQRSIQSLDDIEIKSPEQWNSFLSGKDPVAVLACTMTGCGPCNQFKPALLNAAKKSNQPIYMLNYNGEEWKQAELSKMKVGGFPSVYRLVKGQQPQEYQGDRSEASVLRFASTGNV